MCIGTMWREEKVGGGEIETSVRDDGYVSITTHTSIRIVCLHGYFSLGCVHTGDLQHSAMRLAPGHKKIKRPQTNTGASHCSAPCSIMIRSTVGYVRRRGDRFHGSGDDSLLPEGCAKMNGY